MRTSAALLVVVLAALTALAATTGIVQAQPSSARACGADGAGAAPRPALDLDVLARRPPPADVESEYRRLERARADSTAATDDRRAASA